MRLARKIHAAILAWFVHYFRTREILRVFKLAHAEELRQMELQYWPMMAKTQGQELIQVRAAFKQQMTTVQYRQWQEVAAIKAGKMDVTDRKSWQWPFMPASVNRMAMPISKATPYNLRRMSRTPVPRRAINMIKSALLAQNWDIRPIEGVAVADEDEQKERIEIAKKIFTHPNNVDSYQSWIEMGLEDQLILGGFVSELRYTLDPERPLKMWDVNIESIRIFPSWSEETAETMPHYAQMTGLKGERGAIIFYDDELLYVKDNISTDNPFGLGCMEIAFTSVMYFLGIQDMSGRAGTDQVHKTWLWWEQPQTEAGYQIVRRHIQNELEGQAKVSIIGGMKKPDVLEINPVVEADLLLNWQELLIRMMANGFDMSAMALGIEHDINRAVGSVLDDKDFRTAVVPRAKRLQTAFTRTILHKKLQWFDLEFVYLNLDDPDAETKMDLFARQYSTNAITPNEIRVGMGRQVWDLKEHPFADLTQMESMMLLQEAMAKVQEGVQTRTMVRQNDMQNEQMEKQQQMQQDQPQQEGDEGQPPQGGNSSLKLTPGGMAKEGMPPAPKPMTLPQFKISGTKYNAKELAMMPVNQLQDVFYNSGVSAQQMLRDMANQDPGILEEMTEEVREFFEQILQEEKNKPKKKLSPRVLKMWEKEQRRRWSVQQKRIQDFSTWLQKFGQFQGRPGGGSAKGGIVDRYQKTPAGKPGDINPLRRG